jgi:hypothetical protein
MNNDVMKDIDTTNVRKVTSPGKFEGQPIWAEWLYDYVMDGGGNADGCVDEPTGELLFFWVDMNDDMAADMAKDLHLSRPEIEVLDAIVGVRVSYYEVGSDSDDIFVDYYG